MLMHSRCVKVCTWTYSFAASQHQPPSAGYMQAAGPLISHWIKELFLCLALVHREGLMVRTGRWGRRRQRLGACAMFRQWQQGLIQENHKWLACRDKCVAFGAARSRGCVRAVCVGLISLYPQLDIKSSRRNTRTRDLLLILIKAEAKMRESVHWCAASTFLIAAWFELYFRTFIKFMHYLMHQHIKVISA